MSEYHELVITGSFDLVRGFVTGFLTGRAFPVPAVFSRESGIRRMSLGEKMLTWTGVHEQMAHVIVEEEIAGDLIREITTGGAGLDLKVVANKGIKSASFDFEYKVYARVYGEEIRKIFDSAPSGVKITYCKGPKETLDPKAKGVEMYAPEHDYELRAEGSATGGFADIFPFFRKAVDHPLVHADEIHLEYAG